MNIKDTDFDIHTLPWRGSEYSDGGHLGDMLATMWSAQEELIKHYNEIEKRNGVTIVDPTDQGELDMRHVQVRIKDLMWRITEELGEAAGCLRNRPHKQTHQPTDVPHFREEIADAFHYFLEMLVTCGFSPETLFEMYFRKHDVNEFRMRSNY